MELVSCNLCHSRDSDMIYSIRDNTLDQNVFKIVRCRDCGLSYLNPQPTQEELTKYYPKDYYSFMESDAGKKLSVSDALRYKLIRTAIVAHFGKDEKSHRSKKFYTNFSYYPLRIFY